MHEEWMKEHIYESNVNERVDIVRIRRTYNDQIEDGTEGPSQKYL